MVRGVRVDTDMRTGLPSVSSSGLPSVPFWIVSCQMFQRLTKYWRPSSVAPTCRS